MCSVRPTRILIADDREENRYVLSRVLTAAGYICEQAGTGAQALEMAKTQPDVIILDVHLPDFSGYEVCQKIKQNPLTATVSVLQISASFVSGDDRARALDAGADGYLTHPIDRVVLIATVHALLRLRTAEIAARKAAHQWQSTFDALAEGLALVDADGRLVHWNSAFAQMCGKKVQVEAGVDAESLLQRLAGASLPLRQNELCSAEFSIGKKTVRLSANPIEAENADSGRILILTDITDHKLAEYALRMAEKLAATGKLANTIAHEINNPLEALTNLIYLAGTATTLESAQDFLSHSQEELARIARITKQSLAFHRDTQRPTTIDVGALMKEVVLMYERTAGQRRVRLVCCKRSDVEVCGFPGQLTQAFGNLVRNAVEAAPSESQVVIRVSSIHRDRRKGARVTIHDKGAGIPEEVQERMFDPFFTTKELKGSGLGLWVSKTLVLKHGGSIRFRTSARAESAGTVFEVFLPEDGLETPGEVFHALRE
jgi:two-component system NtrC family sensor kinase